MQHASEDAQIVETMHSTSNKRMSGCRQTWVLGSGSGPEGFGLAGSELLTAEFDCLLFSAMSCC